MIDANNKAAWVENDIDESNFVSRFGRTLRVIFNPAKIEDCFAPDLYNYQFSVLADLKVQREPFRTSGLYGVATERCVTFNVMDAMRYLALHGSRFIVYFWLQHPENDLNGIYAVTMRALYEDLVHSRRRIHSYQTRDGTDGNKTHSFVLDVSTMSRLA